MQERLSQTGLLNYQNFYFNQSLDRNESAWLEITKKVHLKSKKIKKLSRIAWVYYQEKNYETNHKF